MNAGDALNRVLDAHAEHIREHGVDAPGFDLAMFVDVELEIMSDSTFAAALEARETLDPRFLEYWNALVLVRRLLNSGVPRPEPSPVDPMQEVYTALANGASLYWVQDYIEVVGEHGPQTFREYLQFQVTTCNEDLMDHGGGLQVPGLSPYHRERLEYREALTAYLNRTHR